MRAERLCSCTGLAKSYGARRVLRGCTLRVDAGEIVGVVGENGAGKSTLVRCLLGHARPSAGAIEVPASVGYCPQEAWLNGAYTVREHLEFARAIYAQRAAIDAPFVFALLVRLGLHGLLDDRIGTLSGGTRQKVAFLTSVMHRPALLVLDEPYDGFDWSTYLVFWSLLEDLRGRGTGALLITHRIHDRERCDRIYALRKGRLHAA
jgi:ABC-2 type transport system ATP-binding protein